MLGAALKCHRTAPPAGSADQTTRPRLSSARQKVVVGQLRFDRCAAPSMFVTFQGSYTYTSINIPQSYCMIVMTAGEYFTIWAKSNVPY